VKADGISYRAAIDAYRRQLVIRALGQTDGNRAAAARALGLHEKYFLRLMKSLGIGE
jgi:transcriptional regulator with GAF, ATPase, and Fis domain